MAVQYKQKCYKCKKNYVITTSRQHYTICYDCQKESLKGEITDPEFKKLLDIPEEFYKENAFLRSIKANYLRHLNLTEPQKEAFRKVVEKMKLEKDIK